MIVGQLMQSQMVSTIDRKDGPLGGQISSMSREEFYAELISLLRDLKPGRDQPDPQPESHLWAEGYVDSIAMLEIIYFLEEKFGCEIDLVGDFLPSFFTLKSIYDTYVEPRESGRDGS